MWSFRVQQINQINTEGITVNRGSFLESLAAFSPLTAEVGSPQYFCWHKCVFVCLCVYHYGFAFIGRIANGDRFIFTFLPEKKLDLQWCAMGSVDGGNNKIDLDSTLTHTQTNKKQIQNYRSAEVVSKRAQKRIPSESKGVFLKRIPSSSNGDFLKRIPSSSNGDFL